MEKKKRLGYNPLADYLSSAAQQTEAEQRAPAQPEGPRYGAAHKAVAKKERITIHLPVELIDVVKNIVYWEPGVTLTSFAQRAFELAVKEREETRGEPYPERKEKLLKSGRPVG
ncbi:MAG: hypothetical protein WCE21_05445 [Candidatus Babeliales bacterium]